MLGYAWLCLEKLVMLREACYAWRSLIMLGYAWLCLVMLHHAWLRLVMRTCTQGGPLASAPRLNSERTTRSFPLSTESWRGDRPVPAETLRQKPRLDPSQPPQQSCHGHDFQILDCPLISSCVALNPKSLTGLHWTMNLGGRIPPQWLRF